MVASFRTLLLSATCLAVPLPAFATVIVIDKNGAQTVYEAVDYLSEARHLGTIPDTHVLQPANWPERRKLYAPIIAEAALKYELPENLLHAVIMAESAYDNTALSPAGAQGLMQLMPGTAARFGVDDSTDPHQNIDGGAHYLKWLLSRYQGDHSLALAAYNAGEGAVDRYGGIPPFQETQAYVSRVFDILNSQTFSLTSN